MGGRTPHILLVGARSRVASTLSEHLRALNVKVLEAFDSESSIKAVKKKSVKLAVICMDALKAEGLRLISVFKGLRPELQVVMITHPRDIYLSITGMGLGAAEDFLLPLDLGQFLSTVKNLLGRYLEMQDLKASIETSFAAATFAEAGERDTAIKILKK